MADGSPENPLPEGGDCFDNSSSFNTASDSSQEETVATIRKKENGAPEEEHCNKIEQDLKDEKSPENSHHNDEKQRSSSIEDGCGASVNSCDYTETDSINTVDSSKSIGDTSKKSEGNESKGSTSRVNDSKGAVKEGAGKGIGQRLHQGTAASRARQGKKAAVKETPKPPPIKPAAKTVPVQTVVKKKACSTPTKEDCTISDMTLSDVSHIPSALDCSVMAPPMMRMGEGRSSVRGNTRGGAVKKQLLASRTPLAPSAKVQAPSSRGPVTLTKTGKAPVQTVTKAQTQSSVKARQQHQALTSSAAVKNLSKPRDADLHEEETTDEMLFKDYVDYLHAAFINMKTQEAVKNARARVDKQMFQGFSRNEEMRQKVIAKKKELAVRKALAQLDDSLQLLESRLAPALTLASDMEEKMARVLASLRSTQHQLAVKGVTIENQEQAKEELEQICEQLKTMTESTAPSQSALGGRFGDVKEAAENYSKLAESFEASTQIVKECWKLVEEAGELATQEASVAISLAQLHAASVEEEKIM